MIADHSNGAGPEWYMKKTQAMQFNDNFTDIEKWVKSYGFSARREKGLIIISCGCVAGRGVWIILNMVDRFHMVDNESFRKTYSKVV